MGLLPVKRVGRIVRPGLITHKQTNVQYQRNSVPRISPKSQPAVRAKHEIKPPKPRRKTDSFKSNVLEIRNVGTNKYLAIFAPGPSILESHIQQLKDLPYLDTMTVNKPDPRFWPTDYWIFCDNSQFKRNKEAFNSYNGRVINTKNVKAHKPKQIKVATLPNKGFSLDLTRGLYIGRSTTFTAMQVANWMGYKGIFIFGCDMTKVSIGGKDVLHSYGVNPDVPEATRLKRFDTEEQFYDYASKILSDEVKKKFYFCSSYNNRNFVDAFNKLDHREAVDFILNLGENNGK